MKKLLLGSVTLLLFAISVMILQVSCAKTNAQASSTSVQQNKIAFTRNAPNFEIWTANYDGSNQVKIPITLPANVNYDKVAMTNSISVSPDGQTLFFTCLNNSGASAIVEIYSCSINGGNATLVVTGSEPGKVHAF